MPYLRLNFKAEVLMSMRSLARRPVRSPQSQSAFRNSFSPAIRFGQLVVLSTLLHFPQSSEVMRQGLWTSVRPTPSRRRAQPPLGALRHRHGDPSPEAVRSPEIVRVTVATLVVGAK